MAKPFNELIKDFSDERKERIKAEAQLILREIDLQDLRKALDLTQKQLAENLNISQTAISKMESESDMYISTLNKILIGMGGRLKIIAEFPESEVIINQFKEIDVS